MQVSYYLKKGYGQHKNKCKLVGNKVEDFACRLLAYSQDVPEIVEKPNFIYCIEKLTHTAIEYKARKVSTVIIIIILHGIHYLASDWLRACKIRYISEQQRLVKSL